MLKVTIQNGQFRINLKGVKSCLSFDGHHLDGGTPSMVQFIGGRKFLLRYKRHCYATHNLHCYKKLIKLITNVTTPQWESLVQEWESLSAPVLAVIQDVKNRIEIYHRTVGFQTKTHLGWGRGVQKVYGGEISLAIYPNSHHGSTAGDWTTSSGLCVNSCSTVNTCYGEPCKLAQAIATGQMRETDCSPAAVKQFIKIAKRMLTDNGEALYQGCLSWYINQ